MKCNNFNCSNMNIRGYCNVTACTKQYTTGYGNTNFTQDIIVFPFSIGNKTFNSKKELVDYIWLQEDKNYGKGNWC